MAKIDFPKKQEQRLIPKYLLDYAEELQENHPDPSEDWGGSIEAGTGIIVTGDTTKTIAVDTETIPTVAELSTVAFSGSYSDLSNKPDLSVYELKEDAFSGDYADLTNKPDLSVYELKSEAFSGSYNDLTDKPTIPTKTSDLTNDSGYITNSALADYETKFTIMDAPTGTSGTFDADTLAKIVASPESFMFRLVNSGNIYVTLARRDGIYLYYQGLYNYTAGNKVFCRVFRITTTTGAWTYSTKYTDNLVTGVNDGTNWTSITIGDTTKSIPSGGSNYTAGTGIDITNDTISIDNTVALKNELFSGNYNDLTNKPDLTVYELKADAFSGDYNDLTNKPTIPTVPTDVSAFNNDAGYITGINSTDVIAALGYTPGTSNFDGAYSSLTGTPDLSIYAESADLATVATTGSYNDLTNKPTIPDAVSGTNDGTNWTSLTIGSDTYGLASGGSTPSNMVTTDTIQNITGEKTFVGEKRIKFKQSGQYDKLGFTLYNNNNAEKCYFEYNPRNDGLYLGRYGSAAVTEIGFLSENSGNGYKVLMPNLTVTGSAANNVNYMAVSVNNTKADSTGNVTLAIPTATSDLTNDSGYITGITDTMINTALGYTAANAANIPTTASSTSTSTVTPTTTQLVFTYTDNTTETITLMTGASVSTTTTTTLS